ncbi:MAG: hypothetical protein ACR2GQ_03160 [Gemmatimonadota bacterium]
MRALTLSVLAVMLAVTPIHAQFRQQAAEQAGLGLTLDLTFAQLGGAIGDSIGTGFGASGAAFYQPAQLPARIGAGASYTRFATDGPGDALNKTSFFALGSWHIADRETVVVPYIMVRVGYTRLKDDEFCGIDVCPTVLQGREWSGLEVGAVVGVDVPLTEAVNLDVAGSFSWLSLGDLEAGGQTIDSTSTTASTFGLRAGVTVFP